MRTHVIVTLTVALLVAVTAVAEAGPRKARPRPGWIKARREDPPPRQPLIKAKKLQPPIRAKRFHPPIRAKRLQPPIKAKRLQPWIVAAGGQVLSCGYPVRSLVLCFLLKSGGSAGSNMGFKPPLDNGEKKDG